MQEETRAPSLSRLRYWHVALATLVVDQLSKSLARSMLRDNFRVDVLGSFFRITLVKNSGAAFGLFPGGRLFFIIVAVAVVACLVFYGQRIDARSKIETIGLGLGIGGAIGNLVDRLVFGQVTDFLDLTYWPVFNLADTAIFVGLSLLAISAIFVRDPRGS